MCEEEDSDGFGTDDREDEGVSNLPTVPARPDSVGDSALRSTLHTGSSAVDVGILSVNDIAMNRLIEQQLISARSQHVTTPFGMPWSSHSIVRMPWDVGTSKFCVGHEPMVNFLKIDNILIPPDVIEPPPFLPAQTSLRIAAGRLMPGLVRLLKNSSVARPA